MRTYFSLLAASALVAACSGGGDDAAAPAPQAEREITVEADPGPPVVEVSPAPVAPVEEDALPEVGEER